MTGLRYSSRAVVNALIISLSIMLATGCSSQPDPACDDAVQNSDETDIDCGGSCGPCANGMRCDQGSDCQSQVCAGGTCVTPPCGDGIVDPGEDCDGGGLDTASCNADCTAVMCGDGYANAAAGEECDGGGVDTASCDADCTLPSCGDFHVNTAAGEWCDRGGMNSISCDADCTLPECGDGAANTLAGEECDDAGDSATCDADCTAVLCGDLHVNMAAGEECDRGGVDSIACNANCTLSVCGDGYRNAASGEQCDTAGDSASCDADCTTVSCGDGYINAAAGEDCEEGRVDTDSCDADCTAALCGDGYRNAAAGEVCDQGGVDTASCDADCTAALCGDGHANAAAGEQCDTAGDSDTCDVDCTVALCGDGYINTAAGEDCEEDGVDTASCDADCTVPLCGDGHANAAAGEQCDGGGNTPACDADCTTPLCGDGHVNDAAGEQCDDGNDLSGDGCDAACRIELSEFPLLIVWDYTVPPAALTSLLTAEGFTYEARSNGFGTYTSNLALLLPFSMVIFYNDDRAISAQEQLTLNQYVEQGGKLLVTGYDSMAHPLDPRLADVCRVTTSADYVGPFSCAVTNDSYPPLSGPYGTFSNGTTFAVDQDDHDFVQADTARGAVELISVLSAAKLTVAENVGAGSGTVWYWNGNFAGDDWTDPGTARSIFLNLLHDALACAPATVAETIAGPHPHYGFCWYLGAAGVSCDQVCASLGGGNVADIAASAFPDTCSAPATGDISTWFYDNGNAAGWSGTGATSARTLGHGHIGADYHGKCASGTVLGNGTFPGDSNNDPTRTLVCPCFRR